MTQDSPEAGVPAPGSYDAQLRKRAAKRLKRKAEFRQHLVSYAVVMSFLTAIWLVTGRGGGYFWPIWPMLGWGVGLAFHAVSLRWDEGPSPTQIDAEAQRLRLRDERAGALPPALPEAEPGGSPMSPGPVIGPGPWDIGPRPQDRP